MHTKCYQVGADLSMHIVYKNMHACINITVLYAGKFPSYLHNSQLTYMHACILTYMYTLYIIHTHTYICIRFLSNRLLTSCNTFRDLVCVCKCMCAGARMFYHAQSQECSVFACMYVCMYVCMHVCMYVCICMYVCTSCDMRVP
jgi:hypothetical protein